jgi:hypothetical protein
LSLADFEASPWALSHLRYRQSGLAINPAPEYANSEVLVAALYRTIGLEGEEAEGKIAGHGRELDRRVAKAQERGQQPEGAALAAEGFHALLHEILKSPKLPNQSTKRFLQVSPLVGEAAAFSGSARLAGNPMPAGLLTRRMIWMGAGSPEKARSTWAKLFEALSVGEQDDVFARFLKDELSIWSTGSGSPIWQSSPRYPGTDEELLPPGELEGLACPARQFVRDLDAIVAAKPLITRRQWISVLEALLRLAAVAHVAWLCEVHARAWDCLRAALGGQGPKGTGETRAALYPTQLSYLQYGATAVDSLKDRTSRYLRARLGMNALLWTIEDAGLPIPSQMSSASDVAELCSTVRLHKDSLGRVMSCVEELYDREARALMCRKGIGANMMEFSRHVLYQRQTADPILRGYDQGYVLRKKSSSKSSPWICALGPVAVLALVHCALAGLSGPRSVRQLTKHLAAYGIVVDHRDIAGNDLGHHLRMLGLVLDSPDAESGMLLVPPFASSATAGAA